MSGQTCTRELSSLNKWGMWSIWKGYKEATTITNVFLNQHSQGREDFESGMASVISQNSLHWDEKCSTDTSQILRWQPSPGKRAKLCHSWQPNQNSISIRFACLAILFQMFWMFVGSEIKHTPIRRKHPGSFTTPGVRMKTWPSFRMLVGGSRIQ